MRRSPRFYRDAILALGCGLLEQFTGEGGDLRIAAGFQPVEQRVGRLPFLASNINLSEMKGVALVARAQIDGGTLGLQGGGRASAGVAGDRQQIVGVGEFRVPVEHVLQIEHHVGQALYVVMSSLRDAVLENGNVIANPHVVRVEGVGVAELRGGFGEFAVLDVVPGKDTMGGSVADRVVGEEVRILIVLFRLLFGFNFLIGRCGRGGQRVQLLQAVVAAFRDANLDLSIKSARIGLGQRPGCDRRIFRPDGNGEAVGLAGRQSSVRIDLPSSIDRAEQCGLTVEVILHRLLQLRGTHAVGFLNGILDRDVLVQDQVKVGPNLGQLLLMKQVMHDDPRLRVIKRMVAAFVTSRGVVLHREEVGQG